MTDEEATRFLETYQDGTERVATALREEHKFREAALALNNRQVIALERIAYALEYANSIVTPRA